MICFGDVGNELTRAANWAIVRWSVTANVKDF